MMVPPFDVFAEHAKCQGLRQIELDWLRQRSVPRGALIKNALGQWSVVAKDRVVFVGNNRFEFERHIDDGTALETFIIPGLDEFGDLVDLVAWRPPTTVATWLGRVGLVGEELVNTARFGQPLHVFETVIDWLRSGREGVVIAEPLRASSLLRQAGTLAVDDLAHGVWLRQALTIAPPEILIRQVSAEVAA